MKPSELLADLPLGPGDAHENRLFFRLIMRYLADHVYSAELSNGSPLRDMLDFRRWLEELVSESPEQPVSDGAPRRLRLDGSTNPRFEETCNRCGHVHQGRVCGMQMGGGPECRCELEGVPA